MKQLIDILKAETESLRLQYLKLTGEWAVKRYEDAVKMSKWNEVKWCDYFGLTPCFANEGTPSQFLTFPKGFYNTSNSKTYHNLKNTIRSITKMTCGGFCTKKITEAERHYEESIEKLAFRINQKGLDQTKLKAHTSHIGANIDTTLTDGIKSVRAFTIIASGPVQCPHYRYLIK